MALRPPEIRRPAGETRLPGQAQAGRAVKSTDQRTPIRSEGARQPPERLVSDIDSSRGLSPRSASRRLASATTTRRPWVIDVSVVVVLSVLVRLPWVLIVHPVPVSDTRFYYLSAISIAHGHGYQILGHPTAFFPVAWPALLGALFFFTGPSMLAIEVLNLVLWAVTAALVYVLGRRLSGRAAGVVAGVLVAVSPPVAIYVMRAYSEALFIPLLLVICLLLAWRRETPSLRNAALAGVLLGVAILARSTAEFLILLLPLWVLFRRPRRESWRAAVVLCITTCVVLVPWVARNEEVMHTYALSTNGGVTLWLGANPRANGGWISYGKHNWAIQSAAAEVKQNNSLTKAAIKYDLHHPGRWLGLIPAKFTHLMASSNAPLTIVELWQKGPDPSTPHPARTNTRKLAPAESKLLGGALARMWMFDLWHYLYWSLGGIALLLAAWRRRPTAGIAVLLVVAWILFHIVLVHGEPRYMLSVTPLVAPALAWLLVAAAREAAALVPSRARAARARAGFLASARDRPEARSTSGETG
jgi:4-amino-4-deoxy-L-arabinose transferase-like glycosyltransferase